MNALERRRLLKTLDNPEDRLDYIVGLNGTLQVFGHGKPTHLSIQYVPDRAVVDAQAFGRYLEALAGQEWETLEALATAVLGDFSDQLVGRWIRVVATVPEGAYPGVGSHEVMIEDRQPDWENPSLLSRLK